MPANTWLHIGVRCNGSLVSLNKLLMIYTIIPAVFVIFQAVPIFFYDMVGEKKEKIIKELIARREANGTAKAENAEG